MSDSNDKANAANAGVSDSGAMESDAGNITFPTLQPQTPAPLDDDGGNSLPTLMTTKGAATRRGEAPKDSDNVPTSDLVDDKPLAPGSGLVGGPASSGSGRHSGDAASPAAPAGIAATVKAPSMPPTQQAGTAPPPADSDPTTAVCSQLISAGVLDPKAPDRIYRDSLALLDERYELLSKLGIGGMGAVFLAYDRTAECEVAVKIMLPRFLPDPGARQRFIEEAKQMNRIPAHANVLVVKGFGSPAKPYYVMEYMAGGSLTGLIRQHGALPRERVLKLGIDIVKAVCYLHESAGLIHRDIKPDNIMLSDDGSARLCDFGLIRAPGIGHEGLRAGTLAYMPPEVVTDARKNVAFEWDIYSIGAVLYEMLTGHRPYEEVFRSRPSLHEQIRLLKEEVVKRGPRPIQELNRAADPWLARIAAGCMARDSQDRYFRMTDVLADLHRVEKRQAPRGPQTQGGENGGASWLKWAAAALLLVGVVAGGLWGYSFINGDAQTPPVVEGNGNGNEKPPPQPLPLPPPATRIPLLDEMNVASPIKLQITTPTGAVVFEDGDLLRFTIESSHKGYLTVVVVALDSTNLDSSQRPIDAYVMHPTTVELESQAIEPGKAVAVPHASGGKVRCGEPFGQVMIKAWVTARPVWLVDRLNHARPYEGMRRLACTEMQAAAIAMPAGAPRLSDMFKPDEWGTATLMIETKAKAGGAAK